MKIVVIGATSLIGKEIINLLEKNDFPVTEVLAVAETEQSPEKLFYKNKELNFYTVEQAFNQNPKVAFFTGNLEISMKWGKAFSENACYVIDNSPAHRQLDVCKLIIPEINANQLKKEDYLLSSPNCTSIQLAMALAPLHRHYKIKRAIVTTFQAVSGAGQAGINQLENEIKNNTGNKVFAHQIYDNTIPHVDNFMVNGYTSDEVRLINEIKKILNDPDIRVSATCARVPVKVGHSESINIEFEQDFVLSKIKSLLESFKGVKLYDDPQKLQYPMPQLTLENDMVFVGRIRRDYSNPKSLNLWSSANNITRGAAMNSVNIFNYIFKNFISG